MAGGTFLFLSPTVSSVFRPRSRFHAILPKGTPSAACGRGPPPGRVRPRSFYETKQNPGIAAGNASDTLAQRKRLCRRFDHGDRAGHADRGQSVPGGQCHRAVLAAVTNGTVITADNAKITNNSKTGAVQVTAISVTDGAYKVGSYDSFSGGKTIALKINSCVTKSAGKMSITKDAFPKIGAE